MTETPAPYGVSPQSDFASQYQRVLEAAECRTQAELASFLEVSQPAIAAAKRRQCVPYAWILQLYFKKGINPGWVRSGLGSKMLEALHDAEQAFLTVSARRPVEQCTTDELLAELVRRALSSMG